tara:strand:+ start:2494 stop:3444 length:951 start_codon:yes stop_codon:yes gene_type:complete
VVIIAFTCVIAGFTTGMPKSKLTARSKRPADPDPSYQGRVSMQKLTTGVAAGRAEARAAFEARASDRSDALAKAFEEQGQSMLCPITQQLPDNPVRAEDRFLYDRNALEEYFNGVTGDSVRSPVTGQLMGKSLQPAADVRDMFENFIIRGHWADELALAWLARHNEKKKNESKVAELQMGAEKGDPKKMYEFANALRDGKYNLAKDARAANKWYKKAAGMGHPVACATYGILLIHGLNIDKNITLGASYVMSSALLGSEGGCYEIGLMFKDGLHGYPKDEDEARMWMGKMHECKHHDAGESRRQAASKFLTPVVME